MKLTVDLYSYDKDLVEIQIIDLLETDGKSVNNVYKLVYIYNYT